MTFNDAWRKKQKEPVTGSCSTTLQVIIVFFTEIAARYQLI